MADTRKIVATVIEPALGGVGYTPEYLRRDYQIPNLSGIRSYIATKSRVEIGPPAGTPDRLDVLAFIDPDRQNWNTSAVAVDLQVNAADTGASQQRARALFDATAAPTALVGRGRGAVDVWFNCHNGMTPATGVALNAKALGRAFSDRQADVRRDRLADLRIGQRHLFESHLYALRGDLVGYLHRGIQAAVSQMDWWDSDAKKYLTRKYSNLRAGFSKIALALLAARILEDKGAFGANRGQSTDARQLLADAEREYDTFFSDVVNRQLPELDAAFPATANGMLESLLSHLTGPAHFGLVTHEMLGDLYEQADLPARRLAVANKSLLTDEFRLQGVHYTPFPIARRILDRIPFEDLRPADRVTCDLTCGSGAFLVSATDRLAELHDPREPGAGVDRVAYLQRSVCGNDVDKVSHLLVQLTYLLAYWSHAHKGAGIAYPNLVSHNALDPGFALSQEFGAKPSVFVGNPPFDAKEPAGAFLTRAVDALWRQEPGTRGFIGMVLPQTFLRAHKHHHTAREHLLRHANLLELWELPDKAIGQSAEVQTCVVIAEVVAGRSGESRIIRVNQTFSRRDNAVEKVCNEGVPTWSYATVEPSSVGDSVLAPSVLRSFSPSRRDPRPRLSQFVEIVSGFKNTPAKAGTPLVFSHNAGAGYVGYLRLQSALRPYNVTANDWRASHRPGAPPYWKKGSGPWTYEGNWPLYDRHKIVLTAKGSTNRDSQFVAAVDWNGYYPGENFIAMGLRPDLSGVEFGDRSFGVMDESFSAAILRWLCAIFNSPVGHAWVLARSAGMSHSAAAWASLPLPDFDPEIARLVEELERLPRPADLADTPTWDPPESKPAPRPRGTPSLPGMEDAPAPDGSAYWGIVREINRRVLDSYGLSETDQRQIITFLRSMTDPWAVHRPDVADLPAHTELRVLSGTVRTINVDAQTVTLKLSWAPFRREPVTVPIPKFMPGWALEEGREFTCRAPYPLTLDALRTNAWLLRDFRPLPYRYLSVADMERMLGYTPLPTGASAKRTD